MNLTGIELRGLPPAGTIGGPLKADALQWLDSTAALVNGRRVEIVLHWVRIDGFDLSELDPLPPGLRATVLTMKGQIARRKVSARGDGS